MKQKILTNRPSAKSGLKVLGPGVLQLLMDGQLSDESFKEIMIKVLEQLPVIGDIIAKILSGNKSNGEE